MRKGEKRKDEPAAARDFSAATICAEAAASIDDSKRPIDPPAGFFG